MPGWATRCHCLFVLSTWLIVCCWCHVLSCLLSDPPSWLSRYCFSRFTCVLLICLPIYSPGVSSPVLICCFTSCVWYVCTYCSYPVACLFFPLGVVFVSFCFFLLLKTHHSPALESSPHLSSHSVTTAHSNTPHMSTSLCGKIFITPPKCNRNERRQNYYSGCSIVAAAGVMSWRRCVLL